MVISKLCVCVCVRDFKFQNAEILTLEPQQRLDCNLPLRFAHEFSVQHLLLPDRQQDSETNAFELGPIGVFGQVWRRRSLQLIGQI